MSALWLVVASLVWTGLIAAAAEVMTSARVRPHFAQAVWRGAAALMAAPWLAAGAAFLWPAMTDAPLPVLEGAGAPATAALEAIHGAEAALQASAGATIGTLILAVLFIGWSVRGLAVLSAQFRLQAIKAEAGPGNGRGDVARWAGRLGLSRVPEVKTISDGSPFMAGVQSRAVYLPACVRDEEVRSLIIAHECVHLARGDLVTRPLERFVADLVWFSPFAWLARRRLDFYREAVCDAETIALTGERVKYARALTDVARAARPASALPVSGFVPRRKTALTRRVKDIVATDAAGPNRIGALAAASFALIAAPIAIAQGVAFETRANAVAFTHPIVVHSRAKITAGFGLPDWGNEQQMHRGVDVAAPKGAAVYAPTAGKVSYVGKVSEDPGLGNNVSLYLEDGHKMRFASLDKVKVVKGQRLKAGDLIGTIGASAKLATGPHVHVELWRLGKEKHEPIDPEKAGVPLLSTKSREQADAASLVCPEDAGAAPSVHS